MASSDVKTEIAEWKFLNYSKENEFQWFAPADERLIQSFTGSTLPQKMTLYRLVSWCTQFVTQTGTDIFMTTVCVALQVHRQSFIISYMHMYIRKNPNVVFKHIWLAMIWKFFVNASTENSPKCQPINTCSLKTLSSSTPLFVFLSFNKYLYCEPTKCYLCIFLCAGNYNIEHIRQKRILVSWSIYILVGGVRQ